VLDWVERHHRHHRQSGQASSGAFSRAQVEADIAEAIKDYAISADCTARNPRALRASCEFTHEDAEGPLRGDTVEKVGF
jgi:hypothetical protein